MAGFNPATFIAGPAIVTYDSGVYYTKGGVTVRPRKETWNPTADMHGNLGERLKSRAYEISFTPVEAENLDKLYPYAVAAIGANIFPAEDAALTIQTLAGQLYTFTRAAMIKMPNLKLSANDQPFGEVTFLALLATSVAPTTDAAFLSIAGSAFSDTNFDETLVMSPGYTAAFGTSPYAAIESVDGFTVEINLGIKYDYVDNYGLIAARLTTIDVQARFVPTGLTEAQWSTLVAIDGASAVVPGASIGSAATSLIISKGAGYLSVTIPYAGIKEESLAFGEPPRLGELVFVSKRKFTTGVGAEPFTVEIESEPE